MKKISCKNRKEWLAERGKGIGGSDAACILGMNKYKSIMDLYLEKIGTKKPADLSTNLRVQYGNDAEEPLRALFALDFPEYEIYHAPYEILVDDEYDFLRASIDGELYEQFKISPNKILKGILEIKTAEPRNAQMWADWNGKIPDSYYCQILHYLMVTGYSFAIVSAHLIHSSYDGNLTWTEDRRYIFNRADQKIEEDIKFLRESEIKFWNENYIPRIMPKVRIVLEGA